MTDKIQDKPELEREYVINVRRKVSYVPKYKKTNKAIKTIKEFLAKHMKVENRDIRKVKLDRYLNEEMWFRGIENPPMRIKVKSKKINGIVYAELAEVPKIIQYKIDREKKFKEESEKSMKKPEIIQEKQESSQEEKKEEKEKEQSTVEAGLKENKQEAKKEKHEAKQKPLKQTQIKRKAMQK